MKRSILIFFFSLLLTVHLNAQQRFQLAPPLFTYNTLFFSNEASVQLSFAYKGSSIRYTLDGREPGERDAVYQSPLRLSADITTVTARTFAKGFIPSDPVQVTFVKQGYPIKEVRSRPAPHPRYSGTGTETLKDGLGGVTARMDGWWGFDVDTVHIDVTLPERKEVKKLLVHMLQNQGSWIFLPDKVLVNFDQGNIPVAEKTLDALREDPRTKCIPLVFNFDQPVAATTFHLTFLTVNKLPEWHSGKGNHAWMFIDEIEIF
jgi:hypothetical protein